MAATKVGRQPDVWGTLYALCTWERSKRGCGNAPQGRSWTPSGGRPLFSKAPSGTSRRIWTLRPRRREKTAGVAINTYQNGAYWHTPTGWLIAAVRQSDPQLASELLSQHRSIFSKTTFAKGRGMKRPGNVLDPRATRKTGFI